MVALGRRRVRGYRVRTRDQEGGVQGLPAVPVEDEGSRQGWVEGEGKRPAGEEPGTGGILHGSTRFKTNR